MSNGTRKQWRACKLGDFFRIKHGYPFKSEHYTDEEGLVLLTPGNFQAEGGIKLKGQTEKFYHGEFPPEFLLRRGEMLVVMTDLIQNAPIFGSPAFIPEDNRFLHNQRLGTIVHLKVNEIAPKFLFYLLNSRGVRSQIKGSANGSTVRHTAPERIYKVDVHVPDVATQQKIAAVLRTITSPA